MRAVFSGLLAVCLVPLIAHGADKHFETLTIGDDVYRDVTVTRVTQTDVYFRHVSGMGNAKLKRLSPDLQHQFGFDPQKADAIERSRRAGAAVYGAQMQKQRELEFKQAAAARHRAAQAELMAEQRAQQQALAAARSGRWVNKKSPALAVEKWLTPKPKTDGKFVLVDFWATWCGPCRQSIPHLNALQRKFSDRMVIVGMSSESEADVRKLNAPAIEYSSAIDPRHRMASQVGVTSIPHALLIDPSGTVRYEGHPAVLTESLVTAILAQFGS